MAAGNAVPPGVVAGGGVIDQPPGVTLPTTATRVFRRDRPWKRAPGVKVEHVDLKAARLVVAPDPSCFG